MKILATTFVFNELPYLPYYVDYYRQNGCDLYIIDNESTDGTWLWLQANGIPSERVMTGGAFDLRILQHELNRVIHQLRPDWVVYAGADLFQSFDRPIIDIVEEADRMGYNTLPLMCFSALNTGEKHGTPLPAHYFRCAQYRELTMFAKYDKGFFVHRDGINLYDPQPYRPGGVMINYGGCKPAKEQEDKLNRRRKAWEIGLGRNVGKHFEAGKKKGWVYKCDTDIRDTDYWRYAKNTII